MPATMVLVTEITPQPSHVESVARTWAGYAAPVAARQRTVYQSLDNTGLNDTRLMELLAFDRLDDLPALAEAWAAPMAELAPWLAADWRRQVLTYVESVKPTDDPLPRTPYVQMRHVEVKPPVHKDYRAWRERTIYQVVRRSAEVETFLAYHSVLSTEPGVMFISGFSVAPEDYQKVFATEEYGEIVRQAGDTYITGGTGGLYTRIYRRIEA